VTSYLIFALRVASVGLGLLKPPHGWFGKLPPRAKKLKKIKKKKNVVGFAFGGSQTTPKGHGGGFNHLDRPMGVVKLPPWLLAVVEPPSMAKMGWLFFIYLLFLISNNILLLFLISGIRVPFRARQNPTNPSRLVPSRADQGGF
jgi:hypothetical protein